MQRLFSTLLLSTYEIYAIARASLIPLLIPSKALLYQVSTLGTYYRAVVQYPDASS